MGPDKKFLLSPDAIRPLAVGLGACYATDMITVQGLGVGFCYREAPDNDADSGWRFFSGTESQDYVDDPDNTSIYDVNTIANYAPDIIPLLNEPIGSHFERSSPGGAFVRVD
jgi:hypothetical protein